MSDRLATTAQALEGIGAVLETTDNGFIVQGTGRLEGGQVRASGDHRIAMLGAVAGLASTQGVEVDGMEVAQVSYPGFEADLDSLLSV